MLTESDIERIRRTISSVEPRDYETFTHKLGEFNRVLGYIAEWHLPAYDGNSPDVAACLQDIINEYRKLNPKHNMNRERVFEWMDSQWVN